MWKINEEKLMGVKTINDRFNEQYGLPGTPSREDFEARAKAWYYSELLKEERKRQNITQKQLAEMVGKKREYISSLENGKVDMQLSTFFRIAGALGLNISFG